MRGWGLVALACTACEFTKSPAQLGAEPDAEVDAAPPAVDAPFDLACLHMPGYLGRAGSSHRYRLVPTPIDYDAAVDTCAADGAHPVAIEDPSENEYVRSLVVTDTWIGFDDLQREGMFQWLTAAPVPYLHWAGGQPDDNPIEDCVVMRPDGTWNDTHCSDGRPLVCECDPAYQPPPTPACRAATATGFELFEGRRYYAHDDGASWAAAATACAQSGAYLVALGDTDENQMVDNRFIGAAWIGLSDLQLEGVFRWINQAPSGYVNWSPTAPTSPGGEAEDCVALELTGGTWNDVACTLPIPYLCECDPAPRQTSTSSGG